MSEAHEISSQCIKVDAHEAHEISSQCIKVGAHE